MLKLSIDIKQKQNHKKEGSIGGCESTKSCFGCFIQLCFFCVMLVILNFPKLNIVVGQRTRIDQQQATEETLSGQRKVLAYSKEIVPPLTRGLPSFTRQSLQRSRLKTLGLTRVAELNQPQLRWMRLMLQPVTHTFMISTVYVGMPLGSGDVGPWSITMSDLLHFSPQIRFGSSTASFPAQAHESCKEKKKGKRVFKLVTKVGQ